MHPAWSAAEYDRSLLRAALAEGDRCWDAEANLLQVEAPYNPIHTHIKGGPAHPTRNSLHYALLLLERDGDGDAERAHSVILEVAGLQDRSPANDTYGIWGYYAEEPADRMDPADWNWADFLGIHLLLIHARHGERLPAPVLREVHESLRHAAASIIRRNVHLTYTNVAAMGTFVTLAAGKVLGDEAVFAYGKERMARLAEAIDTTGSFTEFNSPSYWGVVIQTLTLIREHVRDEEVLAVNERLHDRLWEHFLARWHPPTRQLSGPMARCYSNDLGAPPHLVKATRGLVGGPAGEAAPTGLLEGVHACVDYRMPDWARPRLLELESEHEHRELFLETPSPETGTTWLDRVTTLGSVNHQDTWLQRRPLFGHWVRPDGGAGHVHVHLVKDDGAEDFDFASGVIGTVQSGPHVAWMTGFACPAGDRHHHLDMIRPGDRFRARSLRLVVDAIGAPPLPRASGFTDGVVVDLGTAKLEFRLAGGAFGGRTPTARLVPRADGVRIEVVFFESAAPVELDWKAAGEAYAAGTLSLTPVTGGTDGGGEPGSAPEVVAAGDCAELRWTTPRGNRLTLRGGRSVVSREEHAALHSATLDGAAPPSPRLSRDLLAP
ncbi:hypothetical protein OHA98_17020 [Streptomyces sp. NBC_00654]|uniref:hypothetical protein n=1 Tax=Streptomyces sp. NBC_00654 TaxID=2975799 RepID=UPI0022565EFB|nr:hypothetical protein [Streptomyces sp. NBC_00654]MCX4966508.1 hypothetical protein [Streptomyces sp. NBC_00654]